MSYLELLTEFHGFLREKKLEGTKISALIAHDNIPEEILDVMGFYPLKMIFAGNDDLMNISQDYLPPSTCSFAQSCIGLFKSKPSGFNFLELIDFIVLSNHCVSDICTSEIISKYFNIPRIDFYVPYTHSVESVKYYKLEVIEFIRQLEKISGKKLDDNELIKSLKKFNQFKKNLQQINSLDIIGSKKLKILQKAILFGPEYNNELEKVIYNAKNSNRSNQNSKLLIFTGCSLFIGDYLIHLIEEADGNIIFYDTWIGNNYAHQIFDEADFEGINDPLDLITSRFKNNTLGDHTVPNFVENKVDSIKKIVMDVREKYNKDVGVVNHIIKFCDHFSLHQATFKQKLQENNIPVLNLERDYSRANKGQLSTRIEAFMEMM